MSSRRPLSTSALYEIFAKKFVGNTKIPFAVYKISERDGRMMNLLHSFLRKNIAINLSPLFVDMIVAVLIMAKKWISFAG